MNRKINRAIGFVVVLLTTIMLMMVSISCVSTRKNPVKENPPTVVAKERQVAGEMHVFANQTVHAAFSIPVLVDQNLSMYNTGTRGSNDKLFVKSISGERIEDLRIEGLQSDCFTMDGKAGVSASDCSVCIFDFMVVPNADWTEKGIVRKVTSISFRLLNCDVNVPVDISIYEKENDVDFLQQCPIVNERQYRTLSQRILNTDQFINQNHAYSLALNWNIQGWGGVDGEDDHYATIVGFRFANEALRLKTFSIIKDNEEGVPIDETKIAFDLANTHYDLTSRQCYWGGNFVEFEVEIAKNDLQIASDSLIMQYTLNGESEIFEVNLATVQLYRYDLFE